MAYPFLWLLQTVVQLIIIVVIVHAVLSWLYAFQIIPRRNGFVAQIYDTTGRLMAPLLRPIRRVIPPIGGLDLSPLVLIIGLQFLVILAGTVARQLNLV